MQRLQKHTCNDNTHMPDHQHSGVRWAGAGLGDSGSGRRGPPTAPSCGERAAQRWTATRRQREPTREPAS